MCSHDVNIALWRRLRAPFALIDDMKRYHKCEWELFDIDRAGCLLCGAVHCCDLRQCPLVSTEDSEVCEITGFCVRNKIYAEMEFADTVASYNMGTVTGENWHSIDRSQVLMHVEQLLLSEKTQNAYVMEMTRFKSKVQNHMQQELMSSRNKKVNLVTMLESAIDAVNGSRVLQPKYERELRDAIVNECVDFICYIINASIFFFKMTTRASEVRILVYGLLYLMRSGVIVNGIQVIPRVAALTSLLPAENTLQSMHDFRPKFITDVENKFKFMFRSMSVENLQKLGTLSRQRVVVGGNDRGRQERHGQYEEDATRGV